MLRAGPQPCQKGLVEDHSGGYRIEPVRPDGAFGGLGLADLPERHGLSVEVKVLSVVADVHP